MRAFFAALVGGACGALQLFLILVIEMNQENERSGLDASDAVWPVFAFLVTVEIVSVTALSMYRISPWVARALGDDWEAQRITAGKRRYGVILQRVTVGITFARRLLVMVDAGAFSMSILYTLSIALVPLLIPRPSQQYRA
jgi:hypothetical protein